MRFVDLTVGRWAATGVTERLYSSQLASPDFTTADWWRDCSSSHIQATNRGVMVNGEQMSKNKRVLKQLVYESVTDGQFGC